MVVNMLDRLCRKDLTLDIFDKLVAEYELLTLCGEKGIFMSAVVIYGSKYSRYADKYSDGNVFKRKNGCILCDSGDYIYYTYKNRMLNVLGTNKDPKINTDNFNKFYNKIEDINSFNSIKLYNFSKDNINTLNLKLEDRTNMLGPWVTDVSEMYNEICNRKWLNKHRLSGYADNSDFYLKELSTETIDQERKLLSSFEATKTTTGRKKMDFKTFYNHCLNGGVLDKKIGLFYKDLLLGYRGYDKYGTSYYVYIENCVSNLKDEYFNEIANNYVKSINIDRVHKMVDKSNKIANEILECKERKEWKKAKGLCKNKEFLGSLEHPKNINIGELFKKSLTENIKSDIAFLRTRVKSLLIYKFVDFMYKQGASYFTVDCAGIEPKLNEYKIRTNNYQISCLRLVKK